MPELYPYQNNLITNIAIAVKNRIRNVMVQLPTGGGKTVVFATIVERFTKKSGLRTLIIVHRKELLSQTVNTLKKWYGIDAQAITADTKTIYDRLCYVAMVETVNRRLIKSSNYLPKIGMVICDERHMGNFNKIHQFFSDSINLGFSATPLAANKKEPLNKYYQTIVCGPQINELIKLGALVQNHTYSIKGVKRSKLRIVNGKFDEKFMGDEFSKVRNVKNTIINYEIICPETKAICFNCNIEHNNVMHQAWLEAGYISFKVDDTTPDYERSEIFRKFRETAKSILNNVGIAIMGFDEASILTVIPNRATLSPTLPIQMAGRGSRPFPGKKFFTILDMGGNYLDSSKGGHGDWNSDRDWVKVFNNPPKGKTKLDAQPVKHCPNCQAIIAVQYQTCPLCGFELPSKPVVYDAKNIELEPVTKNIDVELIIRQNAARKEFYALFQIGFKIGTYVKRRCGGNVTTEIAKRALEAYEEKAKQWYEIKKKDFDHRAKWLIKKTLYETLQYDPKKKKEIETIQSIQKIDSI